MTPTLILGGAECVWDDVAELERITGGPWTGRVVAVNDIGCYWPHALDAWASLHPQKFTTPQGWRNPNGTGPHGWTALREINGHPYARTLWAHRSGRPNAPPVEAIGLCKGGGGRLAINGCLQRDWYPIILAGMPMDDRPHIECPTHPTPKPWVWSKAARAEWERSYVLDELRPVVRSVSGREGDGYGPGWTRLVFGAPDPEFLGLAQPEEFMLDGSVHFRGAADVCCGPFASKPCGTCGVAMHYQAVYGGYFRYCDQCETDGDGVGFGSRIGVG